MVVTVCILTDPPSLVYFFPRSPEAHDPSVQGGLCEQLSPVPHPPDHSPSQQEGQTTSAVQDPSQLRPPLPRTQSQFAVALEEKESLLRQQEDTISEQLK